MFKRIALESWHEVVPIVGFVLIFGIFLCFVVRTMRMKRERIDYMADLPLQAGEESSAEGGEDS